MIELIHEAYAHIRNQVVRTPLLTFPALDQLVGGKVVLKPENLQHTGSFKYRGGLNHIRSLSAAERPSGVLAFSSGNHAQGVARAARDAGVPATIIMPKSAPQVKIDRTKADGARVILYDIETERREDVAAKVQAETGAKLIPPYDHKLTIAGQGTLGLEVVDQLGGARLDQALICCGGGGLAAGAATALKATYGKMQCYTCEPDNFDDFAKSLATGGHVTNAARAGSICDAIITPTPGQITFDLAKSCIDGGVSVSDEEALDAVAYAAQNLRLIVEPGGAVALAAALTGKVDMAGKTSLVVISGGNIDSDMLMDALSRELPANWR